MRSAGGRRPWRSEFRERSRDGRRTGGLSSAGAKVFCPAGSGEPPLIDQMTGARWKLNRLERTEVAMFAGLESPGSSAMPVVATTHHGGTIEAGAAARGAGDGKSIDRSSCAKCKANA